MSESSIFQDFSAYRDQYGLFQNKPLSTSGNGLLYTAHAVIAFLDDNAMTPDFRLDVSKAAWNCWDGLALHRHPGCPDQEGPDDFFGIGTISAFCAPGLAESILAAGRMRWPHYVYSNSPNGAFNMSAWMGRFPALICHLEFAAGEDPSFLRKAAWIASLRWSATRPATDQDSWIMAWTMTRVAEGHSWICDRAIEQWRLDFRRKFPGGIAEVLAVYFGAETPYSRWLKESK